MQSRREMRRSFHVMAVALVVSGCSWGPTPPSPLIAEPGVGVPGLVELGMSVDQVRIRVRGEGVRYRPTIRYPWQIADYDYEKPHFFQARASHTRKLGEKPTDVQVAVPHLGLTCSAGSVKDPIRSITFWSHQRPGNSNVWFTGRLPCGLSFADRRRVSRDEVVRHFGEPTHHLNDEGVRTSEDQQKLLIAIFALLNKGETVSKRHSNGVEHLHYPTSGIMFILQQDTVLTFDITEKVEAPETPR
jgi:hypothetical protein